MSAAPTIPDLSGSPFAIARCIQCDYDLNGIPAPKTCPECGMQYDASALLITGIAGPRRRVPFGREFLVAAPVALLVAIVLGTEFGARVALTTVVGASIALIALRVAIAVAGRRDTLGWRDVHLYISAAGIALCTTSAATQFIPWALVSQSIRFERSSTSRATRRAPRVVPHRVRFRPRRTTRMTRVHFDHRIRTPATRFLSAAISRHAIDVTFDATPSDADELAWAIRTLSRLDLPPERFGLSIRAVP